MGSYGIRLSRVDQMTAAPYRFIKTQSEFFKLRSKTPHS